MIAYPWASRRVVHRHGRRNTLDCGHVVHDRVTLGDRKGIACPACAAPWLREHRDSIPAAVARGGSWQRLLARVDALDGTPPPLGVRVPVQLPLIVEAAP